MNLRPLAFPLRVTMPSPSPSDKTADTDRLLHALEDAGYKGTRVPISVMKRLSEAMRRNSYELEVVIGVDDSGPLMIDISAGGVYGLAFDIGSTNIECSLYDLSTSQKIDVLEAENPQVAYGSDVLTRLQRAMTGEFDLLCRALLTGMNGLISDICRRNGVSGESIFGATIAGNTIMSHFFLGLDVRNIPLSPYIPAVNGHVFLTGIDSGLGVHKNAVVYVFPNAGSYVGGDIISGIIYSGLNREADPVLFIDVGTNVEVTLGCRDWIMTGAGAAGPALEDGVASIGRKADPGTIRSVRIDPSTGKTSVEVMEGAEPAGICGSGLIDLVFEMFKAGIIDSTGRFEDGAPGMVDEEGIKAFEVYSSGGKRLLVTEPEIRNFLVSKAAMFSFLYVFVRSVGLTFGDIKKVFVSGALGCGINPESAIGIGMLPDIPRERLIPLGNSSLAGAEMVLLDSELIEEVRQTASLITYREMNEDNELMNVLQGAMFIPHTEPGLLKV